MKCLRCGGTGTVDTNKPALPIPDPLITDTHYAMEWLRIYLPVAVERRPDCDLYMAECRTTAPNEMDCWRKLWLCMASKIPVGVKVCDVTLPPEVLLDYQGDDGSRVKVWRGVSCMTLEAR